MHAACNSLPPRYLDSSLPNIHRLQARIDLPKRILGIAPPLARALELHLSTGMVDAQVWHGMA